MRLGACRLNAVTHLAAVAQIVTRFLRLAQQGLGPRDRRLQLGQRRHRQAREVLRLIHQALRLVGQHLDLIVDLLQLARRRQHVLAEVGGIVDDPLRKSRLGKKRRDR